MRVVITNVLEVIRKSEGYEDKCFEGGFLKVMRVSRQLEKSSIFFFAIAKYGYGVISIYGLLFRSCKCSNRFGVRLINE